jgi:hypothetical protein
MAPHSGEPALQWEVSFMNGSRKITVRLPAKQFTVEESANILRSVLSWGGCVACFSGLDISFINETELIVSDGGEVAPLGSTIE